jgi:riboflavin-specific deaminase-like protein
MNRRGLPFVFLNAAITADGKISPASRRFEPFGGPRDHQHLLELRATADAVMAGARTVDLDKVNMGPGSVKYRRMRLKRGLAEYNLRVIVSGAGTIDPQAEIFRHRFSPIIILTSGRASQRNLRRLQAVADEVKVCGKTGIDFVAALRWLRAKWKVKRLLCEGGGEVNAALFEAGLVDEVHLTLCPLIFGGRDAPTLADGKGVQRLSQAPRFRLVSMKQNGDRVFLIHGSAEGRNRQFAAKS